MLQPPAPDSQAPLPPSQPSRISAFFALGRSGIPHLPPLFYYPTMQKTQVGRAYIGSNPSSPCSPCWTRHTHPSSASFQGLRPKAWARGPRLDVAGQGRQLRAAWTERRASSGFPDFSPTSKVFPSPTS